MQYTLGSQYPTQQKPTQYNIVHCSNNPDTDFISKELQQTLEASTSLVLPRKASDKRRTIHNKPPRHSAQSCSPLIFKQDIELSGRNCDFCGLSAAAAAKSVILALTDSL